MHVSVLILTVIVGLCGAKSQANAASKCEACKNQLNSIRSNQLLKNWIENSEFSANLIYDVVSNENLQEACENLMICQPADSKEINTIWKNEAEAFKIFKKSSQARPQKNNQARPQKNNQARPQKNNQARPQKNNQARPYKNNQPRPARPWPQRNNQNPGVMHHVKQIGCSICPKCC